MLAKFTGLKSPTFDDYISDLAGMFDTYPINDDQQLHEVRKAMALIDDVRAVIGGLNDEIDRKAEELPVLSWHEAHAR